MRRLGSVVTFLLIVSCGVSAFAQEDEKPVPRQTRTFDVRDLLVPVHDFLGPEFETQSLSASVRRGTSSGSGGIFGTDDWDYDHGEAPSPEEMLEDLIHLIRDVIEPGSWDEGSGNAIRGRQGIIIATHELAVLDRAQELLDQLRRTQWRMVSVHVSIVKPKPETLKQIVERRFFLATDAKEQAELRKLAGDVVAEARVVCREGQRTYTAVSAQRNFVQDVTQEVTESIKDPGAVVIGSDPDIGTVQAGLIVDARPTIAADGGVMLDFRCSMAVITGMDEWPSAAMVDTKPKHPKVQLPHIGVLVVQGQYRLADGAVFFASGGTMPGEERGGPYALVQVDVIDEKASEKK